MYPQRLFSCERIGTDVLHGLLSRLTEYTQLRLACDDNTNLTSLHAKGHVWCGPDGTELLETCWDATTHMTYGFSRLATDDALEASSGSTCVDPRKWQYYILHGFLSISDFDSLRGQRTFCLSPPCVPWFCQIFVCPRMRSGCRWKAHAINKNFEIRADPVWTLY